MLSAVAPYLGAWIEMVLRIFAPKYPPSLPTWGRGLKFAVLVRFVLGLIVAPYLGAWIEMAKLLICLSIMRVAPYLGAWIEIACLNSSTL